MPSCVVCGKECARVTCSEECRQRRANDLHNERKRLRRAEAAAKRPKTICTCTICGKEFEYTNGKPRKTCGAPKCQLEYRRLFDIERYGRVAREFDCPICGKRVSTFRRSQVTCGATQCHDKYYRTENELELKRRRQLRDGFGAPIDPMPCPWATGKLDTLPVGVTSWDCADMDPLGCGTAMVMLKFETEAARKAA